MNKRKKQSPKVVEMNTQFARAFLWLQANAGVKSAKELAELMETSPSTISELINNKRPLTGEYVYRLNAVLAKHKLELKDFNTDYLNKQAGLAGKKSKQEAYESLISTKVIVIEAGMEACLEKLSILEKMMGELLKELKS